MRWEGRKMFERLTIKTDICIEPENEIVYHNPNDPEGMYNILDLADCLYSGGEAEAGILMEISRRLAAYEDSGLSPEEVQKLKKSDASKEQCTIDQHGEIHRLRDELKRYKQAEQEGRLYNLPLKPGDTIYRPAALQFCWVITKVEIYEDEIVFIDDSDNIFRPDDIGKTVFLTREEAEKAIGGKEDA
jgi:hypothetical protein